MTDKGTNKKQGSFSDQDILTDMLSSEKFVSANYNTFTNECATPNVLKDFTNILNDEHKMQNEIFTAMQARGWYQTEAAEATKINQAKQKFQAQ